jgi:PKD repeat protein
MRFPPVLTLALGAALLAACSGGDSNGPSNTAPTASFTFACTDLACTFTDHSFDNDGTVASYGWSFGDAGSAQNTAISKDATHTFSAAGPHSVQLTVTDNGGATNAKTTQVTVTSPTAGGPSASFDVTCTSLDCTVTNTSTNLGSAVSWAWDFGDGNQTSIEQNPGPVHYDVSAITTFTITLVVTSDGATSQAQEQVAVTPAATLTCNGVDCTLGLDKAATVVVTLQDRSCEAHGDKFVITAPVVDTLFKDGCFNPKAPDDGSSFTLNNGQAFEAGTQLSAEVLTGVTGAESPQLQVTGNFANGWTLSFDDGFVGPGEPDFNDLVITVKATPVVP